MIENKHYALSIQIFCILEIILTNWFSLFRIMCTNKLKNLEKILICELCRNKLNFQIQYEF